MKDPKDTAKTDKRGKRKVTKAFTETEKEELGVLRSVAAATQEQTNRDISDLLGKYMATKMRKLSQSWMKMPLKLLNTTKQQFL